MQDQQPDSGDLNTEEAADLVPEGKAGRRRHRMPRQKLRQGVGEDGVAEDGVADAGGSGTGGSGARDSSVAEPVAEPVAKPEPLAEPEPAAESVADTESESVVEPEPVTEPEPESESEEPPARRRFGWRRTKAEPAVTEPTVTEPTEPADGEDPVGEATRGDDQDADSQAEPTWTLVPHQRAGRRLKVAAIAAGVLFVLASAFAGATLQPYVVDRAEVQTKLDVARTAQAAITTLWTYTPEDMDKLQERAAKYLGGDFAADYKNYITGIVEANKQAQISNSTQVLGAAVESLTPTEASAIIYTNSVATSPVTKGIPSLRYLSYRLELQRRDGKWLITKMTAVTSLDLTPRL